VWAWSLNFNLKPRAAAPARKRHILKLPKFLHTPYPISFQCPPPVYNNLLVYSNIRTTVMNTVCIPSPQPITAHH
jgi:hypothetical protein